MQPKVSFYILTYNSEKYLGRILEKVKPFADEIIIVDSYSSDNTQSIARLYTDNFYLRIFDNFIAQRSFAIDNCSNDWVFCLDSDEVPSKELIQKLQALKQNNFQSEMTIDAYRIQRYWYIKHKPVHSFYPITSPDYPIRLFRKAKCSFENSSLVHETIDGFTQVELITEGHIDHFTFESDQEIRIKLAQYTDMAAIDAKNKGKDGSYIKAVIHAIGAGIKWYFLKQGYKDGVVGLKNAQYAFLYTYFKYMKLIRLSTNNKMLH